MTFVRCLEWEKKVVGLRALVGSGFRGTRKAALTTDDPSDHHRFVCGTGANVFCIETTCGLATIATRMWWWESGEAEVTGAFVRKK